MAHPHGADFSVWLPLSSALINLATGRAAISNPRRLMLNVVGAAAEFEHDMIKERLADARAYLKSKGRRVAGRVPFGYQANRVTRQREIVDLEAEIIQQFFEFAAAR